MRKIVLVCFLLSGCVSYEASQNSSLQRKLVPKRNLTKVHSISKGMSKSEVKSLMGEQLKTGYVFNEGTREAFEPIQIKSPYRIEILTTHESAYEVLFYYTQIRRADGLIAEDELTPLVFQEDQLTGKGWSDYYSLKM